MIRPGTRALVAVAAMLAWPVWLAAQAPPPRDRDEEILKELRDIKLLLQQLVRQGSPAMRPPVSQAVSMRLGNHASLGSADAPVTIVEFTDYQCGYCKRFRDQTFDPMKKAWIDTGKVRFVTRDLPIQTHAQAPAAARAARCAGEQQRFWEMRDALFANPSDLSAPALKRRATELGLDSKAFDACLDTERFRAEVEKDVADAIAAGISSTPSFIVGRVTQGTLQGNRMAGAQPLAAFEAQFRALLGPAVAP